MTDLKFTPTHEWLKKEGDVVTVGITEHAQQLLGDLVFIEFPELGDTVSAGGELGVVESVKAAADFYAPVSGVVIAVNEEVRDNPALVNHEPHTAGWLVKLQPTRLEEYNDLMSAEQYKAKVAEGH